MNQQTLAAVSGGLTIALKVLGIVAPIFVAFFFKQKDAMSRLVDAIPAIYDAVQAQRATDHLTPLPSAIGDMLKLASQVAGRALTAAEQAHVTAALTAHDAQLRDQGHTTTPLPQTASPVAMASAAAAAIAAASAKTNVAVPPGVPAKG